MSVWNVLAFGCLAVATVINWDTRRTRRQVDELQRECEKVLEAAERLVPGGDL